MNLIRQCLNLVLPPRCPVTGEEVSEPGTLSPRAWRDVSFITRPFCPSCSLPYEYTQASYSHPESDLLCASCLAQPPSFDSARSSMRYDDASRDMILAYKHADRTEIAISFAPLMITAGADFWKNKPGLIPVPLHPFRLLKRRYNQAALLAQLIAKHLSLTYLPDTLLRVRHTPPQGHLSPQDRNANVKRAFRLNPRVADHVKGADLVVIDDVYTTGATVNACARVLKEAGAKTVNILTIARAVK